MKFSAAATLAFLSTTLTTALPTQTQPQNTLIPDYQLAQARAFAYAHWNDATFRLDTNGQTYYTPATQPNGISWADYAAYCRAYGNYLCSLGYTAYCGGQPANTDPFARRPTYWQDPSYYNAVANAWRNPADFYGARRVDPYTGQVFNGGVQSCTTDEEGNQSCVA
ncbi:hypothetical protein AC578_914 [Pseudocercospora eumusae]|uniref:Secreted protein n=1 Tax=Pseudocercospora eumusae TaxID=321146 RepID=A0A139HBR8_9PEZI|nr:hypothetical protein AC578_914 [Pseudocercospora eumusae]